MDNLQKIENKRLVDHTPLDIVILSEPTYALQLAAADELASLRAERDEAVRLLKESKNCIDEMAYQACNADISDHEKLSKIKQAWMNLDFIRVADFISKFLADPE